MKTQQEIRAEKLKLLKQLSSAERVRFSLQLGEKFLDFAQTRLKPAIQAGESIGLYQPLLTEPELSVIENHFRNLGVQFCYPRLTTFLVDETLKTNGQSTSQAYRMDMVLVSNPPDEFGWEKNRHGILQPRNTSWISIDPDAVRLIFVPGVAFGLQGQRIGRGKGFYDRYLSQAKAALKVSLIFDCQWVNEPFEENAWDQRMDWVISPNKTFLAPTQGSFR